MSPKKSLEDILAEYTEDLMAEQRPRLAEDIAALSEEERSQLIAMLPLVRDLKAAYRETPPPREAFLQGLDSFVRKEIAQQPSPASQPARDRTSAAEDFRTSVPSPALLRRRLELGSRLIQALKSLRDRASPRFDAALAVEEPARLYVAAAPRKARWRFAAAAVVVLLLGLQILLYLHVRQLEQQNQALVARLEKLGPPATLVPLGLPRGERTTAVRDAPKPEAQPIDELIAGVELRLRIEQRIGELEKGLERKTGRDRQNTEALLQELRALLRRSPKP